MPFPSSSSVSAGNNASVEYAQLSAANTNRDGTGTLVTLKTGDTRGSGVVSVGIKANGTTTAGMIRFFVDDGVAVRLIDEVAVDAVTPGATVQAFQASWIPGNNSNLFGGSSPLLLPPTVILKASTEKAEVFNLVVNGYDM